MFIFIWNLLLGKTISLDITNHIGRFVISHIQVDMNSYSGKTTVQVTFQKGDSVIPRIEWDLASGSYDTDPFVRRIK